MRNILGISIGTRNVGLAIIKQRKLVDCRIRTFPGKWTPTKCQAIVNIVASLIQSNNVTDLTIKIPDKAHCSENIRQLIEGIERVAKDDNVSTHCCTLHDLISFYFSKHRINKNEMVTILLRKYPYPELVSQWKNGERGRTYNAKLFEAIACAELALRAGH